MENELTDFETTLEIYKLEKKFNKLITDKYEHGIEKRTLMEFFANSLCNYCLEENVPLTAFEFLLSSILEDYKRCLIKGSKRILEDVEHTLMCIEELLPNET